MGCKDCDMATDEMQRIAFLRIGNDEIGYGNIGLIGCTNHIKLALEKLNKDG